MKSSTTKEAFKLALTLIILSYFIPFILVVACH
jgi:hypothetical protein